MYAVLTPSLQSLSLCLFVFVTSLLASDVKSFSSQLCSSRRCGVNVCSCTC